MMKITERKVHAANYHSLYVMWRSFTVQSIRNKIFLTSDGRYIGVSLFIDPTWRHGNLGYCRNTFFLEEK